MAEQFIGCTLSVELGGGLGFYQGKVKYVNPTNQILTLTKVLHNGKPTDKEVNINASDILDLKILHSANVGSELAQNNDSKENVSTSKSSNQKPKISQPLPKPFNNESSNHSQIPKKLLSSQQESRMSPQKSHKPQTFQPIHPQASNERKHRTSVGELLAHVSLNDRNNDQRISPYDYNHQRRDPGRNPNKKTWGKQNFRLRDENTFGTPIDDDVLNTEFDFEKNLALFNKQAVMEEIGNSRPDIVRETDVKPEPKYRCDENVLSPKPQNKRQIIVPSEEVGDVIYVTDNGLLVPSISTELRMNLLSTANQNGLTKSRQLEMIGRAATEVIISMIGGSHRLEPGNSHQTPVVVILCGVHTQGAAGVNCGRQLESQGVKTWVVTPPIPRSPTPSLLLSQETQLYAMTQGKLPSNTKVLPSAVDLIVDARFDLHGDTGVTCDSWMTDTTAWATVSRAPLIALDPPNSVPLPITPKIRLCPSLPLAHPPDQGRVYIMNLNIPQQVFSSLGIKYTPPFGPKMTAPLHTCE